MITEVLSVRCSSLISAGSEVLRVLQQNQRGQVLAVFERSLYVLSDAGIVCVGLESVGRGPLQLLLGPEQHGLISRAVRGQAVVFEEVACLMEDTAYSGQRLHTQVTAELELVRQRLRACSECVCRESGAIDAGFGWLLDEHASNTAAASTAIEHGLRRQSAAPLKKLKRWLAQADSACPAGVAELLGAGPGLTPAGDDLLAGVMLALHENDQPGMACTLWQVLEPALATRTHAISAAHLRMAAKGQCSEPVRQLLTLLWADEPEDSVSDVRASALTVQTLADSIGGSSGWDTLAGISLVASAHTYAHAHVNSLAIACSPH